MTSHEQLSKVDVGAEQAVDTGAEQLEGVEGKAQLVQQLENRLDAITDSNAELSETVATTQSEAALDFALANPDAVASDAASLEAVLPAVDPETTAALIQEAGTLKTETAIALPDDPAMGAKVESFLSKHLGAEIAGLLEGVADITVLPALDVAKAVLVEHRMPTGREVLRSFSAAIPLLGPLTFDSINALTASGKSPENLKRLVNEGKALKAIGKVVTFFVPEAAAITVPAGIIAENVSGEVAKSAAKKDANAADHAKAILRGALPQDKAGRDAMLAKLSGLMKDPEALKEIGIEQGSTEAGALSEIAEIAPDELGSILDNACADSGGIVETPDDFGADLGGGIVEELSAELPTGTTEM